MRPTPWLSRPAIDRAIATYGQLDILVNNAGTAIPKPFEEASLEELDHVIDLNIRGHVSLRRRRR